MSGLKACKQIPKRQAGSALQETAAEAQPSQVESGDIRATRRAIETAADTVAAGEIAKEKVAEGKTRGLGKAIGRWARQVFGSSVVWLKPRQAFL